MQSYMEFQAARDLLLSLAHPVACEKIPLAKASGRLLALDMAALEDVPGFDNSPYDGYALAAADTLKATKDCPLKFPVVMEIAAGFPPPRALGPGQAAKILTGAPLPPGADAVIKFEETSFTKSELTIFSALRPGQDLVKAGEDIKAGALLARRGQRLEPALMGVLAAQGFSELEVYRRPIVGLMSTGSELVEPEENLPAGGIRNSSRYVFEAAVRAAGGEPIYFGSAPDEAGAIAELMAKAAADCDLLIATGGVSVGDYDLTPEALARAGAKTLVRGLAMKPGGACAYGKKDGCLIFCLSGRPASALVNFYAVVWACLRKTAGREDYLPAPLPMSLAQALPKASRQTRAILGRLELGTGQICLRPLSEQGRGGLSRLVGANALAVVEAGSPPLEAGDKLRGWLLD